MMIVAELKTLARKVNNYEIDATGTTAHWPDTTHYVATVPTGKRWILLGGTYNRAVSSTAVGYTRDSSGNILTKILEQGAATGIFTYPTSAFHTGEPRILDAGEDVWIYFGTAQDASSYASCVVLEVDV